MKRFGMVLLTPLALAAPAHAITGADLFVDLQQYIGKEVVLEDVEVYGADNDGARAKASGVTFGLSWQGADRETMRQLLRDCHTISGCKGLRLLVTPSGRKETFGDTPILINVKKAQP
jgi:hypothetical protein